MTFVLYLIDANNGLIWNGTQNGFDAVVDSLSSVSWLLMMYLCVLWQDTFDGEIDIEIPEGVGPGDTFEVSLDTGGGGAAGARGHRALDGGRRPAVGAATARPTAERAARRAQRSV